MRTALVAFVLAAIACAVAVVALVVVLVAPIGTTARLVGVC